MYRIEINCSDCKSGKCCRDGVDVDLEEAKRISRLRLKIRKPWFEDLFRDDNSPSGWVVGTAIRDNRCVFQDKNKRCLVYRLRPRYCREFPYEGGRPAPFYEELCNKGKVTRINKKNKR